MLLQTNSYIVPKEKRAEHSRLIRRFRQTLLRLGCDHFEVYEQVGSNWSNSESAGRYVQILRFLDRKHQLAVQAAERSDPTAQAVIADFCDLINFPYQQQQGLFAVGFYTSVLPVAPKRGARGELVSTVEHEVINDPEAEMPYPGSSDGPPLEEGAADPIADPIASEPAMVDQPREQFEELAEEPMETSTDILAESSVAEPLEEPIVETNHHAIDSENAEAEQKSESKSDNDFMKLVGGDLGEELDDDSANGFIASEFLDETGVDLHDGSHDISTDPQPVEPAKSKNHPPGW
jgi:hypothetical protein